MHRPQRHDLLQRSPRNVVYVESTIIHRIYVKTLYKCLMISQAIMIMNHEHEGDMYMTRHAEYNTSMSASIVCNG